jgi:hypothetical protein
LQEISSIAFGLSNLETGAHEVPSVTLDELIEMVMDKCFRELEAQVSSELQGHLKGIEGFMDFQAIHEKILNAPGQKAIIGILKMRSQPKKPPNLRIDITEEQIADCTFGAKSGLQVLNKAQEEGLLSLDQCKSVLSEACYVKNANLKNWKPYYDWGDGEKDAAVTSFGVLAKGRNNLSHGNKIDPRLLVDNLDSLIKLFGILKLDGSLFLSLRTAFLRQKEKAPERVWININGVDRASECVRIQFDSDRILFGRSDFIKSLQDTILGTTVCDIVIYRMYTFVSC